MVSECSALFLTVLDSLASAAPDTTAIKTPRLSSNQNIDEVHSIHEADLSPHSSFDPIVVLHVIKQ